MGYAPYSPSWGYGPLGASPYPVPAGYAGASPYAAGYAPPAGGYPAGYPAYSLPIAPGQ